MSRTEVYEEIVSPIGDCAIHCVTALLWVEAKYIWRNYILSGNCLKHRGNCFLSLATNRSWQKHLRPLVLRLDLGVTDPVNEIDLGIFCGFTLYNEVFILQRSV